MKLNQPQPAPAVAQVTTCASCSQPLRSGYYYLPGRKERFCSTCITQRPRCSSCAAPVGGGGWLLHDGRHLCGVCHQTAVYSPEQAVAIFEETVEQVAEHPGLQLRVGVSFRLVDQPALRNLALEGGLPPGENDHTLGLYQRHGRLRAIYALYGLPKLTLRTVIAHELAHAWQGENCPLLQNPVWREGFAEWVAYRHLKHIGAAKAAEAMLSSDHPYRPGLDLCVALERERGVAGVLDQLRRLE